MCRVVCAVVLVAAGLPALAENTPKAEVFGGFSYANYELLRLTSNTYSVSTSSSPGSIVSTSSLVSSIPQTARMGLYGWDGSITANLNRWFELTTDFSGNYSNSSTTVTTTTSYTCSPGSTCCNSGTSTNCCPPSSTICVLLPAPENTQYKLSQAKVHNFLFGPQFAFSAGKVRPFAHLLLGGCRKSTTETVTSTDGAVVGVISSTPPINPSPNSPGSNMFAMAFGGGADFPVRPKLSWRVGADYLTNQGTYQDHVRVSTGLVWKVGR